jgi:hypothetical protein
MAGGRALDSALYRGKKLGPLLDQLRLPLYDLPLGMVFTTAEVTKIGMFKLSSLADRIDKLEIGFISCERHLDHLHNTMVDKSQTTKG